MRRRSVLTAAAALFGALALTHAGVASASDALPPVPLERAVIESVLTPATAESVCGDAIAPGTDRHFTPVTVYQTETVDTAGILAKTRWSGGEVQYTSDAGYYVHGWQFGNGGGARVRYLTGCTAVVTVGPEGQLLFDIVQQFVVNPKQTTWDYGDVHVKWTSHGASFGVEYATETNNTFVLRVSPYYCDTRPRSVCG